MQFIVRLKIGNRFGRGSKYTLREFCVFLVERYSLTETELCTIATLQENETFNNEDMRVTKTKG